MLRTPSPGGFGEKAFAQVRTLISSLLLQGVPPPPTCTTRVRKRAQSPYPVHGAGSCRTHTPKCWAGPHVSQAPSEPCQRPFPLIGVGICFSKNSRTSKSLLSQDVGNLPPRLWDWTRVSHTDLPLPVAVQLGQISVPVCKAGHDCASPEAAGKSN